ncbi:putative extracellular serine carboxypeptidase [Lasiodiplodia theobromae]|uniref:Putative extracellular serine carboxypeptidase n=1 Tax=Lasiodiplodia theobromae TaxID=45133 RepID=A0A5N5D0L6_9PEZI|nr:putative extracellular serine carboxypeptidase [Lasiodiplodia theobromae]
MMLQSSFRRALPLVLACTYLQHAHAIGIVGGSKQMQLADMAERGLFPDGTPMDIPLGIKVSKLYTPALNVAAKNTTEVINPEFVTLPLDHFGDDSGTFENRFWVAESGYKGAGHPVFIYDAGEADAEPNALFRLKNETSFFKQIVDAFGGIGIVWEHRYYGASVPVNISLDTDPEDFIYLTSEQALADVPAFAANFSRANFPDVDFSPSTTPWIFIGGSYPGMRAAFMRQHYPDTIFASYASSAPVQAQNDMSVYFEPVYRGLNAYGFGNCSKDIHAAINYMDDLMEDDAAAAALKTRFLGRNADKNSNAGFGDALSTIFWYWQSYGVEYGLRPFCDWLETDHGASGNASTNGTVAGADGWAPSRGPEFVVKQWAAYPNFAATVSSFLDTECESPVSSARNTTAPECNLEKRFEDPSSVSWTWQYCTQWGFLQSANLGPGQIVSRWNSLQHQADICRRQFPTANTTLLPEWPRDNETNESLGGWGIRPSNVYWSGGEFDPWRTLSPLSAESWAPHPKMIQDAPRCGESTSEDEIFGYVIPGAQHCYDFRTTFAPGAISRKYFTDALTEWLKCF